MTFATNHIGHFLFTNLIMPKIITAAQLPNRERGETRIINVTSLSPTRSGIRWSDMDFSRANKTLPVDEQPNYEMLRHWGASIDGLEEGSYVGIEAYNQSKVANVLYSIGLNKRLYKRYGILSLAVHPGIIRTELSRYADAATASAIDAIMKTPGLYIKTLGAGSSTSVVAAVSPRVGVPVTKEGEEGTGRENLGVYWMDCEVSDGADWRAVSGANAGRLWGLSEDMVGEKFSW